MSINDIEAQLIKDAKARFNRLHSRIFGDISDMLRVAKLEPLHVLTDNDPSFTALVVELDELRGIVLGLWEIMPEISSKANLDTLDEYLGLTRELAVSIESGCSDSLGAAISALDEKPYI
ncbi:MAG: hypothetical protein ACRBBW_16135 [Cellvibrionaceae bacterium]